MPQSHAKGNRIWIAVAIVAGISLFLRLSGAISLPANGLYNVDEKTLTDSAVYLTAGQSPVILEWPAGFSLLLLYIWYGIGFLLRLLPDWIQSPGVPAFVNLISTEIYQYNVGPWKLIIQGRVLFTLVSLIPIAGLLTKGFRENTAISTLREPGMFWFWLAFAGLLSPMWVIQSWSVLPDSITTGIWIYLLFFYLFRFSGESWQYRRMAILFGILLSCKLTYIAFLPVLLAMPFVHGGFRKLSGLQSAKILLFAGMVFLLCCPFFFSDTLMLAKSFAGNFLSKMQGSGSSWGALFGKYLPILLPVPVLVMVPAGILIQYFRMDKKKFSMLLVSFLLFLVPVGNSGHLYTRYVLPLLPFLLFWSGLGLSETLGQIKQLTGRYVLLAAICLPILLLSVLHIERDFRLLHQPSNLSACVEWVQEHIESHTAISIPAELQDHLLPDTAALKRIISLNTDPARIAWKRGVSFGIAGVETGPGLLNNPLLQAISGDEEAQAIFKSKVSLRFAGEDTRKQFDLYYHHRFCENFQLQTDCLDQAISGFYYGTFKYLITTGRVPGRNPLRSFTGGIDPEYFLYGAETE